MTVKVIQTCDRCKTSREITTGRSGCQLTVDPQQNGWRPFGDRYACPDCVRRFMEELG